MHLLTDDVTEPAGSIGSLRRDRGVAFLRPELERPTEQSDGHEPSPSAEPGQPASPTPPHPVDAGRDGGDADDVSRRDVADILTELPDRLVDVVGQALERIRLTHRTREHLDPDLWGEPPDHDRYAELTLQAHLEAQRARDELVGDSLAPEVAARAIGVTPDELTQLVEDEELVTLEQGGQLRLPAWQFQDGEMLPGIAAVCRGFPGSVTWLSAWMTSPHRELDGETPATVLALGRVDRVLALVRQMHG